MKLKLSIFCCLLFLAGNVQAQKKLLLKVDSFLMRLQKSNVDTNYIMRPDYRLTVRLLSNLSGANFHLIDREKGAVQENFNVRSDLKWTLSSSLNYRGIAFALAVNPGHVFKWYHDLEFNLNAYGNRMGADIIFQRTTSLHGTTRLGDDLVEVPSGRIEMRTINADYYYVFNFRRFSYPAAFTQSWIQKRSEGSFIAGATFESLIMDIAKQWRILDDNPRILDTQLLGVGVGYGYNFVPTSRWLIHVSVLPTIVVWKDMFTNGDGYTSRGSHPFSLPNMLTTARFSVVHYFDTHFAGIMGVLNHSHLGQSGADMTDHIKWRLRLFYGLRF